MELREYFDFSTGSSFERCQRYAYWCYEHEAEIAGQLIKGFSPVDRNLPAEFGTAFHEGLAAHYEALRDPAYDGPNPLEAMTSAWIDPPPEANSTYNSAKLMDLYLAYCDRFSPASDYLRTPKLVEQGASAILEPLSTEPPDAIPVNWVGRIDLLCDTPEGLIGVDHKTTGWKVAIADRVNPNTQITGYLFLLQEFYPNVAHFMFNVIYSRGKVIEFYRPITTRSPAHIARWKLDARQLVADYHNCQRLDSWRQFTTKCLMFNKKCEYHYLCLSAADVDYHEIVPPTTLYQPNTWQPWEVTKGLKEATR